MNTLIIKNVSHTYRNGTRAMDNISLQLGNGMFGLLGPNGAGKSTLMRCIAGLQRPDAGVILFNGVNIVQEPVAVKKQLGYLPQDFGVYPGVSAYRLLDHLAVLKGIVERKARQEQILGLLDKTNLYAHRHKAVSSFSGGMRQRFGIAQALLGNPAIIIVDEPTAGLDPEERNRFNNLLSEIGEQVIVILSTHLVEDVRNLCTQMAVISKGSVIAGGRPDILVDALQGKVWKKLIDKGDRDRYAAHVVLSAQFHAGRLALRILADICPGDGFAAATPGLEDVYFATIRQ